MLKKGSQVVVMEVEGVEIHYLCYLDRECVDLDGVSKARYVQLMSTPE